MRSKALILIGLMIIVIVGLLNPPPADAGRWWNPLDWGIWHRQHVDPQPQPEPTPIPDPVPPPEPTPNPDPVPPVPPTKLLALVIEETADRGKLPVETVQAILSPAVRAYMDARGIYRVVDKDVHGPDGKPPAEIAAYLVSAVGKPLPRILIVDPAGKTLYDEALPKDEAGLLSLLKQFTEPPASLLSPPTQPQRSCCPDGSCPIKEGR